MSCKLIAATLLVSILIVLVSCGPKATPTPEPAAPSAQTVLKISGSGTTSLILDAVAPAFNDDVPGCRLDIMSGTGTGGGVKGVVEGVLDVAAMARPPKDEETAQGIEYVEFGKSGVAILVHPGVDVTNLTTAQVTALFSGEITNWSEVGGTDRSVTLYVRDEGDSSTKALREIIWDNMAFPETAQVLTSQSDMQTAVARTPGSAGFGSWPSALAGGLELQAIALDGVAPGDPAYPILTPIGIGYRADREADVQPLIDWLSSEQGQAALHELEVVTIQ